MGRMRYYLLFMLLFVALADQGYAQEKRSYPGDEDPWVVGGNFGFGFPDDSGEFFLDGAKQEELERTEAFFDLPISLEMEVEYYVHPRFSFGASVGYLTGSNSDINVANIISGGSSVTGKVNFIPFTFVGYLHLAPYGNIRPYVGAGMHYAYINNKFDLLEFSASSGAVFEAGLNWWMDDYWGFSIGAKQFMTELEVDYTNAAADQNLKEEVQVDPLIFNFGAFYRL